MSSVRVLGELDRTFAWDGARLYEDADLGPDAELPPQLRGAAVSARPGTDGRWRLVRDPLGVNKLFWVEAAGSLCLAARPWRLTEDGHDFDAIRAIPRGSVIDLDPSEGTARGHALSVDGQDPPSGDVRVDAIAGQIRSALNGYLAAIASAHPGARAFVCLSGGLDSSGIAAVARDHFPGLVAVSFDLDRDRGEASEDRLTATRLARDLGLPLLEATVSGQQLLEHIDPVLLEGIDWRDFNVHAALVNAALGQAISDAVRGEEGREPVLVFTGDLANEFLADYEPEQYRGSTYYGLPKLSKPALRRILVRGLDTSHREIGVFGAWGLAAVQPYAAAADAYLALPDAFISRPDCKAILCREVFGERLPGYVFSRRKARAQIGGADAGGGVLGLCVDHGFDASTLKQRFAELHGVSDLSQLDRFMRSGLYRSAVPSITGVTSGRA
jgi:asparagine synthetase B (glutamine-hydrolysing)